MPPPVFPILRFFAAAGCVVLSSMLWNISSATTHTPSPPSLPLAQLQLNQQRVAAEIADTDALRATGLMHRTTLATNHGMLFVFPDSQVRCFWMKNTLIPLSIAFADASGKITALAKMQPASETTHCSTSDTRYALEMNQNWFARHDIQVGAMIKAIQPAALPVARDDPQNQDSKR